MLRSRLFNWFFYGHVQIALAAAGLCWVSLRLGHGLEPLVIEWPIISFVFFATLGVYTLHRYLSFQRAGVRPTTERYNIVSRHPKTSILIGVSSLITSSIIGIPFIPEIWTCLLWVIPLTFFYLTPPVKGWKRLRDIPFIKVLIVGIAWQLMTNEIPVRIAAKLIYDQYSGTGLSGLIPFGAPDQAYYAETFTRTLFTLSIAILFDFRDTVLDRSQRVKTLAGNYPILAKSIVSLLMGLNIYMLIGKYGYPDTYKITGSLTCLAVLIITWLTNKHRSEAWYAVVVNGLLWGPTIAMMIALSL